MRGLIVFAVVLFSGAAFFPAAAASQENPILFYADLSADEETSPTDSPATGRADFKLDRATLRLTWHITYKDLTSPPVAAHIHGPQRRGVVGSVLFDIAPKGVKSPLDGSVVLTDGQVEYLFAGWAYMNIKTVKYKEGEVRGQIHRVPAAKPAP